MSKLVVVAKVVAKKEFLSSVKIALLKLIAPTRNEEGCIEYTRTKRNNSLSPPERGEGRGEGI